MTLPFPVAPTYIVFFVLAALLYLLAAMALGAAAALLTLPVLYYTGYGVVPPRAAPASGTDPRTAALVQVAVGMMLGAASVAGTVITSPQVPLWLRYEFARISPRAETVPALASALGVVVVLWLTYLLVVRKRFASADHHWATGLSASVRATLVFAVCFLAVAVLSTFTRYL